MSVFKSIALSVWISSCAPVSVFTIYHFDLFPIHSHFPVFAVQRSRELSKAELHELFRLADPDHSKSIDLDEFRHFLSDLRSLETEPERFQEKMDMRVRRCSRAEAMETRRSCQDEFGLFNDSRVGSGRGSVLSGRSPTGRQCSRAASARSMSTNGIANKKSTITEGDEMRDMEMAGDRRKSDGQERTLSPSWNKTSDTYPVRPVMDSDAASAMEALSSERKEHEEV